MGVGVTGGEKMGEFKCNSCKHFVFEDRSGVVDEDGKTIKWGWRWVCDLNQSVPKRMCHMYEQKVKQFEVL